jgi:hypothetical protein
MQGNLSQQRWLLIITILYLYACNSHQAANPKEHEARALGTRAMALERCDPAMLGATASPRPGGFALGGKNVMDPKLSFTLMGMMGLKE